MRKRLSGLPIVFNHIGSVGGFRQAVLPDTFESQMNLDLAIYANLRPPQPHRPNRSELLQLGHEDFRPFERS